MMRSAILFGAIGLIGNELLKMNKYKYLKN